MQKKNMSSTNPLEEFFYKPEPKAAAWIEANVSQYIAASRYLAAFDRELREKTSSKLFDWLDSVGVLAGKELHALGFEKDASGVFRHPAAQLPGVKIEERKALYITVDSIADFLMVRGVSCMIEGSLLGGYRQCLIHTENDIHIYVVERRSYPPVQCKSGAVIAAYELWKTRPRRGNEESNFQQAISNAILLVEMIGKPMAATVVLDVERQFWQTKNRAGQVQKARQDSMGMGWANHDHHTFRSSRKYFTKLVQLFEILGFYCRERFYAGSEAGWGAQVMEHPDTRLVLFLDVDLSPEELLLDFAHQSLPERNQLGTIGLWCALHGESILEAGMHHLEAQFLFDELRKDLAKEEVKMMDPFSNFPYLKQAFTVGERWKVNPLRIQKLLEKKLISETQAEQFLASGAIGSHLENLERHDGFKGFNQKAVSDIIHRTDPRYHLEA